MDEAESNNKRSRPHAGGSSTLAAPGISWRASEVLPPPEGVLTDQAEAWPQALPSASGAPLLRLGPDVTSAGFPSFHEDRIFQRPQVEPADQRRGNSRMERPKKGHMEVRKNPRKSRWGEAQPQYR